jgi:hypothetical protein
MLAPVRTTLLIFLSLLCAAPFQAQAPIPSLEMPVLFVDHEHRPVAEFHLDQLRVKTGTGAAFTPTSMRKEGDDPLSLTIFIDASRDSLHDLAQLGDDLAPAVGTLLLPADRVSIYAADCTMTRSLNAAPPDAAVLKKAVKDALDYPTLHGGKSSSACGKTVHLWDDAAAAIAPLTHAPGRRVLLLVSSGFDGGSKYDWLAIQQYAFDNSVAIFALRDQNQADADDYTRQSMNTHHQGSFSSIGPVPEARKANDLELLCANAGGLTLSSSFVFRKDALADIFFLIKSRYILTIPKDAYQPGTSHSAKVSITPLTSYFITATGAGEPVVIP